MVRYNIDGEYLVPFKDEVFTITKRIGELGELSLRQGDYSTTFSVPICTENSKILRYTPELNHYNTVDNFKKYIGFIEEDGNILSQGYFQVTEFNPTKGSISLKFYGGNTDWFELLKGRYINKEVLPTESVNTYLLDEFAHYYNYADVTGSFGNTDNYIYFPYSYDANIDTILPTDDSQDLAVNIENFIFAFYQHTIFKKIFDSFGIKLEGSLFNDPTYWSTAFTTDEDLLSFRERDASLQFQPQAGVPDDNGIYQGGKRTPLPTDGTYVGIGYDAARDTNTTSGDWDGDTYTSPVDTDNLRFIFQLVTEQPPEGGGIEYGIPQLRISYTINGVPQTPIVTNNFGNTGSGTFLSYSDRYSVKWAGDQYFPTGAGFPNNVFEGVKTGDTFKFELTNINSNGNSGDMKVRWGESSQAGFSSFIQINDSDGIPKIGATDLLPSTSQAAFVKDVLIRHGAVTQYNSRTKTLTVDKFEDIENNIPIAIDWSNKVDLMRERKVDYTKILGKYGRFSYFRYENVNKDDPYMKLLGVFGGLSHGDGTINIDNDMIPREAEIYTSPYSACAQVLSFDDNWYMPYIPTHKQKIVEKKIADPNNLPDGRITVQVVELEHNPTNNRVVIVSPSIPFLDVNNNNQSGIYLLNDDGTSEVKVRYTNLPFAYFAKVPATSVNLNNKNIDNLNNSLSFEDRGDFTGNALIPKNYQLQEAILNKPLYVSIYMNLNSVDVSLLDHMIPVYLEYYDTSGYFYVDSVEQYRADGSLTKVNFVKIS